MPSALDEKFKVIIAAYTLLRRNEQVLLLRRANTGYRDGQYSLPAGHIDGDETAVAAAARELREEAGLVVVPEKFSFVHVLHSCSLEPTRHERVSFFFEVWEWEGEPVNTEPGKCDELRWVDSMKLPTAMVPEVAHVLHQVAAGNPYSSFGFS